MEILKNPITLIPISFDVERIAQYFRDKIWTGTIKRNDGNVKTASLWGEQIANDVDFGRYIEDYPKRSIGIIYEFGGRRLKIRITERGFFQIFNRITVSEFVEIVRYFIQNFAR